MLGVIFFHLQFAVVKQGASSVSAELPHQVPYGDFHHTASAKSPLYAADSSSFTHSQQAMYQTDSVPLDIVNQHNNTADSCCELDAGAVSSCDSYGRDAFMNCEPVLQALDMGFDYEAVRNVVHLKMVQSGTTCLLLISNGK